MLMHTPGPPAAELEDVSPLWAPTPTPSCHSTAWLGLFHSYINSQLSHHFPGGSFPALLVRYPVLLLHWTRHRWDSALLWSSSDSFLPPWTMSCMKTNSESGLLSIHLQGPAQGWRGRKHSAPSQLNGFAISLSNGLCTQENVKKANRIQVIKKFCRALKTLRKIT